MNIIKYFNYHLFILFFIFAARPVKKHIRQRFERINLIKENTMQHAIYETSTDQTDKVRHAYNIAFEKLDLNWHWDAKTFHRLQSDAHCPLRRYLETEQAHLLSAYEVEFLLKAIETAKVDAYSPPCQGLAPRELRSSLLS
jgi:hypothetical protein